MSAHAYFTHIARFLDAHAGHTWAEEMRDAFYEDVLKAIASDTPNPARLAEIALGVGGPVHQDAE